MLSAIISALPKNSKKWQTRNDDDPPKKPRSSHSSPKSEDLLDGEEDGRPGSPTLTSRRSVGSKQEKEKLDKGAKFGA